ncbi:hypothetical protein FAZ19_16400 [Sphingobacterium alkalisoli]|uniref:Signal transduction histidine kinase internal region domain-containing protein n=1 Tax=Sphingobacterium alkalisoli TaxID=1874115 RepID=A0A4U0GXE7_9SPHI|nr:hypothetical protein [Sphingobacterium alkalisoli]TJY63845.1 hypothetical protein FAZ19_16400 [Sphingobacterium alkalisoli]
MSGFIDRIFGGKSEVDVAKARYASALSFERSQLDKCLLGDYLKKHPKIYCSSFNQFLQGNLMKAEDRLIPLSEELDCLKEYIELYKTIREAHFYVEYEFPIEVASLQIYPFMMFPMVQNAIQNGYNTMEKHPIKVRIKTIHEKVQMEVSNRINHHVVNQGNTHFVEFYKQRLFIHYPEDHELIMNSNSNKFKATVSIQLNN